MNKIYYRHWCKTCEDFTLHEYEEEDLYCTHCNTKYTDICLSEIPKEKLEEQRERYRQYRKKYFEKFLQEFYIQSMSSFHQFPEEDIVESDAGLKKIQQKEIEERRRQIQNMRNEVAKYINVNRNDICPCGSGKKYKRCHLKKIQEYKNNLR